MAHPILIAEEAFPALEKHRESLPPILRDEAERGLHIARNLCRMLAEQGQGFPYGDGPIETLLARWIEGEINATHAQELAGQASMGNTLSSFYVRTLSFHAERNAQAGNWQRSVDLFKLLLAALDARTDDIVGEGMHETAVAAWLDIAARATSDVPDGRIFHDAKRRGDAMLARARSSEDLWLAAEFSHRLGVLHLDPYIYGRTSTQFHTQIQTWLGRLEEVFGAEVSFWKPPEEATLPDVVEGIDAAVGYLRAALMNREDEDRARTLKALAEALVWRGIAGGKREPERVVAAVDEALALLVDSENEALIVALQNLRSTSQDQPSGIELDRVRSLLEAPIETLLDSFGVVKVLDHLTQAATLSKNAGDPVTAFTLLERAASLAEHSAPETKRVAIAKLQANALAAMVHDSIRGVDEILKSEGVKAAIAAVETGIGSRQPELMGRMLLGLSVRTSTYDMEHHAPEIIERAVEWDPELVAASGNLVRYLLATLGVGAAVNNVNASLYADAIQHYMRALENFVAFKAPSNAVDSLRRGLDLLDPDRHETIVNLVVPLAGYGVSLEAIGGPAIREMVQRAWRTITGALFLSDGTQINPELILLVLQGAKGGGFAGAWENWSPVTPDDTDLAIIGRIETARDATGSGVIGAADHESSLDENTLLMSFLGEGEELGAAAPNEVLQNLQVAFDARIERRLTPSHRSLEDFLDLAELQKCLDDRSVLLIQMVGQVSGGAFGLVTMGVTKEEAFAAVGSSNMLPSARISMTGDNRSVELDWLGLTVSAWREALLEEPGPADMSPEAEEALRSAGNMLFGGGIAEHLSACKANGKDHLIIAPHGALHFFPLHVLDLDGRPLAEDWTVTAIPNICLLRRRLGHRIASQEALAKRRPFAALGLDFEGGVPHNLPPLPDAAEEVRNVAGIFNTSAHVNGEATESQLIEDLKSSRIVHLASHGRHRVAAPGFQAVFLWPDADHDGIVEAWELLDLDLEGLGLVGLSACETALGRFDVSDNLRGLPAALFLAGAESMVGTLWEVLSEAAHLFFTEFYTQIAAGSERRDAFSHALRSTRATYPAYRDWGAFYLAGEWGHL